MTQEKSETNVEQVSVTRRRRYSNKKDRILLVGNGFDLACYLPTKYANFIHTVEFLLNNYQENMTTVGDVFESGKLQKADPFIKECYTIHKNLFDSKSLKKENVERICSLLKENEWFRFFSDKLTNEDAGWIDFEKEIAKAILLLNNLLTNIEKHINDSSFVEYDNIEYGVIRHYFPFLFDMSFDGFCSDSFSSKYYTEIAPESERYDLNKQLIIDDFAAKLDEVKEALKLYIHCFAEFDVPNSKIHLSENKEYDCIFSFNYSDTIERTVSDLEVIHIHGTSNGNIVLGVNENDEDELATLNTSFIRFKKYYQRVLYQTDYDYLGRIRLMNGDWGKELEDLIPGVKPCSKIFDLEVFGHSLDITDRDIIKELFDLSKHIIVYYHNEDDIGRYIKNLVSIYGKAEFDDLRYKKSLSFLPANDCTFFTKSKQRDEAHMA